MMKSTGNWKRNICRALSGILASALCILLAMQISTMGVTRYFQDNFLTIDPYALAGMRVKVHQVFTWHNFFDGTLWVRYYTISKDENGKLKHSTVSIPVTIKIHRENGRWQIVSVYEMP